MSRALPSLVLALAFTLLGGCVVYEPVPVAAPQPTAQQRYDQSWAAAVSAMTEQRVKITSQDRGAGAIQGDRVGIVVTAMVRTQADGSVQVSFETVGAADKDPGLAKRLRESYLRRMGR